MKVWIAGGVTGQERLGLILIATRSFAFAVEDDLINVLSFNGVGRPLHVSDWKQANSSGLSARAAPPCENLQPSTM
ncbi:hypothetical protein RLEG12_04995 (plasmid) [Rhizobium leguminosarum bv. trifolii CB782]|nr:hypothetical protein RLEG12_04995 [Rhizobium leguminosarum bv. trifolii CB782]